MRSGSSGLSPEASSVLEQSLLLASRRGHPQLTPLHVAAALLSTSSRFSSALKSSSSPRALQLCLNVSLNRLPSTPAPPSPPNTLNAALKRAQAQQRRSGWPDPQPAQQNCFLSIRVDLDRLIISILDDPSVSRVMREAGFSSTSVKNNLEEYFRKSSFVYYNNDVEPIISSVFDVMLGRKRRKNVVIVGETSNEAEGLASRAMDAMLEGLDSVKLVKVQFSAVPLRLMRREEIEMNVADLRRKVESFGLCGRVVVYVGDLKWAVERESHDERTAGFYSPVHHLIAEIGEMVSWYSNGISSRVWLMATASYETLMKCERKEPCVDVLWDLEAVRVPYTSGLDSSRVLSKDHIALSCCPECVSNFEKEYYAVAAASAQLPYWLKPHANNNKLELTRKYNSLCQNMHNNNRHQVKTTLSLGNPAEDGDTTRRSVVSVVRMKLLVHGFNRKRKPDRDFAVRVKSRRNSKCVENDAFDLNVKAEDDEDHHDERGQFSPISSDLTREDMTEQQSSMMFLERIKNQLVFDRDLGKAERAREMLLSKLKSSFHRTGDYVASFEVDENVLEEVFRGSGFYRNDLFDKWVQDVFRSSLGMIGGAGEDREKVSNVRLCLDGESGESCGNDGFMGTCLPKIIPLCFI